MSEIPAFVMEGAVESGRVSEDHPCLLTDIPSFKVHLLSMRQFAMNIKYGYKEGGVPGWPSH